MNYLSVCSGIEAATCAWHPLGWTAQAFSEIESFPCKVLAHHYPTVLNLGDMTKFKEWPDYANLDVLVGGTPCQSFSIAGLRKGLDDPRGNLMLTYLAIANKYRPTWVVWENVPGVLSSDGGRDFGTFLGGLGQLGYGFAYRVLDAQYVRTDGYPHAVPQRRRRVFVVGYLGDWRRAAAVLFDSESMSGNSPPRREAGQAVAGTISACSFSGGPSGRPEGAAGNHFIPVSASRMTAFGEYVDDGTASAMKQRDYKDATDLITVATSAHFESMSRGCDGGGKGYLGSDEVAFTLSTIHDQDVAIAFSVKDDGRGAGEIAPTLCNQHTGLGVTQAMRVRRLTPLECERLQGFSDNYTNIPGASDTARYKALGNSMAVNVMQLIGQRIQMVNQIQKIGIAA